MLLRSKGAPASSSNRLLSSASTPSATDEEQSSDASPLGDNPVAWKRRTKRLPPILLLGGCAGKVKTGGVIETPVDHVDVLQTLARAHATETAHGNVLNHVLA